jgi:hypothetical protein
VAAGISSSEREGNETLVLNVVDARQLRSVDAIAFNCGITLQAQSLARGNPTI